MPTLFYLVGAPGAGKTTLMAALTAHCAQHLVTKQPVHEVLMRDGKVVGAELGRQRGLFSGTDALSMSISPKAKEWIATRPYGLVLGEGARLATTGFLGAALDAGYDVKLAHLATSPEVAAARRAQRGTGQNETWVKGATTRAENLVRAFRLTRNRAEVLLPGDLEPENLVTFLCSAIPELKALRD